MDGFGWIKIGYLENVCFIVGFIWDEYNIIWVVVGMVNNDLVWNGQVVLDWVLYFLYYWLLIGIVIFWVELGFVLEIII